MGIEAILARGAQILLALGGAYLVALWFVLVVWTYRDIESRSKNVVTQIFSTLLVVLFWVPGVLLYMILRPKETLDSTFQRSLEEEYLLQDLEELPLCPSCERYVQDDFVLCPHCHTTLRDSCHSCGKLVDLTWTVCPYCAADQGKEAATAAITRISEPEPRYLAPKTAPSVSSGAATAITPAAAEAIGAPRRMISPGERPAMPGNGRTPTDVPHPFTIVAGTPPRPATGRFRPQVRAANGKASDADGASVPNGVPVKTANGRSASGTEHEPPAPFREIPTRTDATPVRAGTSEDEGEDQSPTKKP